MYLEIQKNFGCGPTISEERISDGDFRSRGWRSGLDRSQRLTRNGILRDTPNLMMRMCLPSSPQYPNHFQQSLFLRWFRCWVLVLAGLGSTFGFAVGRAKSPQSLQAPEKAEEKVQEAKPREAPRQVTRAALCKRN